MYKDACRRSAGQCRCNLKAAAGSTDRCGITPPDAIGATSKDTTHQLHRCPSIPGKFRHMSDRGSARLLRAPGSPNLSGTSRDNDLAIHLELSSQSQL